MSLREDTDTPCLKDDGPGSPRTAAGSEKTYLRGMRLLLTMIRIAGSIEKPKAIIFSFETLCTAQMATLFSRKKTGRASKTGAGCKEKAGREEQRLASCTGLLTDLGELSLSTRPRWQHHPC